MSNATVLADYSITLTTKDQTLVNMSRFWRRLEQPADS
jgi:hypothetical protein